MEDYGLSVSDEDAIRLSLEPQDLLNATDLPMAGWPSYQELYRCDPPVLAAYEASQIAGLEGVGPRTTCNRVAGRDIVSRALEAAGAVRVDASEWLKMNEKGDMYAPMMVLNYVVYRPPQRSVRDHCNSIGPWGRRLGPRARGSLSQKMHAPRCDPPASRRAPPIGRKKESGGV